MPQHTVATHSTGNWSASNSSNNSVFAPPDVMWIWQHTIAQLIGG